MKYIYGIDVGGTNIKIGLFDSKRNLINKYEIKTRINSIVLDIVTFLNELDNEVYGYGIGIAGSVNNNGVVINATNLYFKDYDFKKEFLKLINHKAPVILENDSNVAALSEDLEKDSITLTIGTGIGAGIIINHKLLKGSNNLAGEVGHINIGHNKICACGKKGCFEAVAGLKSFLEETKENIDKSNIWYKKDFSVKDMFENSSFPYFNSKINELADNLGKGISILTAIINPSIVYIGGGLSNTSCSFLELIKEKYLKYCFNGLENLTLCYSTYKSDSGIYGASKLIEVACEKD